MGNPSPTLQSTDASKPLITSAKDVEALTLSNPDEKTEKGSEPWEKLPHSEDETMVHIFVGASKKEYILPKKPVCSQSAFFDKAFNGQFAEANSSKLYLEEVDPEIFTTFAEWVSGDELEAAEIKDLGSDHLISLYLLADRIQCDGLKNISMDCLQDSLKRSRSRLTVKKMKDIFANTASPSISPLRTFCVATISHDILNRKRASNLIQGALRSIPDFLEEFIKFQGDMTEKGRRLNEDPRHRHRHDQNDAWRLCDFHSHKGKKDCTSIPNCTEFCHHRGWDSEYGCDCECCYPDYDDRSSCGCDYDEDEW